MCWKTPPLRAHLRVGAGAKQRGAKSVEAANVFYHLTYEGAVDVDAIEDENERAATRDQIKHFGQTPPQLAGADHEKRLTAKQCASSLFANADCYLAFDFDDRDDAAKRANATDAQLSVRAYCLKDDTARSSASHAHAHTPPCWGESPSAERAASPLDGLAGFVRRGLAKLSGSHHSRVYWELELLRVFFSSFRQTGVSSGGTIFESSTPRTRRESIVSQRIGETGKLLSRD